MFLSPLFDDPWAPAKWVGDFGSRPNLPHELRILGHAFPLGWRQDNLEGDKVKHPLAYDLLTIGGRARLLVVAEELLRLVNGGINFTADADVPLVGRLHNPTLFAPMASEFLAARILGPLGQPPLGSNLDWQPDVAGWRCDFRVDHNRGLLLAEVKRPWVSRRVTEFENRTFEDFVAGRRAPGEGRVFTDRQEARLDRAESKRFRPHFRKAADQLQDSAQIADRKRWRGLPGILFVDTNPNWRVYNTIPSITRWMSLRWARPIDLVVFLDYASRDGVWGVVAQPMLPPRSTRALSLLRNAHPFCRNGHIHVPPCPRGSCDLPFGF